MLEHTDKRSLISKAACELFEHYGFNKTSLEDIAKAAQVGKGSIYYYFESKEDIFVEVVEKFMEEFLNQLKQYIDKESTFEGKFTVYFRTPVTLLKDNAVTLADALRSMSIMNQTKIEDFRNKNKKRISNLLAEIMEFGADQGIVSETVPVLRFIDVFNQWFLLLDADLTVLSREEIAHKIERDHELLIQIILYGITKRG